jgi:hypothetical protein
VSKGKDSLRPSWLELAFREEVIAWSVTQAGAETILRCEDTGISAVLDERPFAGGEEWTKAMMEQRGCGSGRVEILAPPKSLEGCAARTYML